VGPGPCPGRREERGSRSARDHGGRSAGRRRQEGRARGALPPEEGQPPADPARGPRRPLSPGRAVVLALLCPSPGAAASSGGPGAQGAPVPGAGPAVPLPGAAPAPWRQARFPDPVLVPGDLLPGFQGLALSGLRVFRWKDGAFVPIRFQVDERTEDMDWVFPYGKKNNAGRGNGVLDGRDLLLFMARDAGVRAPPDAGARGLPGASPLEELALEDPVDGARRFAYLAFFPHDPPPRCPLPDYVRYDYENEEVATDCVVASFIITPDGLHTSFSRQGGIPETAGGHGENRIDRLKFRLEIRFFFNLIPLRVNEEAMGQDVVAYIRGPIRVIRRMEQFMKLPFGVRGMRTYSDVTHYQGVVVVPVEVHVPLAAMRVVSSANIRFGMDFAPAVFGDRFANSENPEPLVIDGRMSPAEQRFCRDKDEWSMVSGPSGVYMTRAVIPREVAEMMEITQEYEDDLAAARPPESFPGSIGYVATNMEVLKGKGRPGRHRFFMDVYFPPFYARGDETAYLDLRRRPLKIVVGGRETANGLDARVDISEDFTK